MRARFLFSVLIPAALTVGACAVQHSEVGDDEGDRTSTDAISRASKLPSPADPSQHLYFSQLAWSHASSTSGPDYWIFSAKGGQSFTIGASSLQEEEVDTAQHFGFKLHYLYEGKWRLWTQADSAAGVASVTLKPHYQHWYLLEIAANTDPDVIELSLTCPSDKCSIGTKPGDTCGGIAALRCDDGQYCDFGATCGKGDMGGHCTVVPQSKTCAASGGVVKGGASVCGCDGKTYSAPCSAAISGISVAHDGACGTCPLTPLGIKSPSMVAGSWRSTDGVFGYTLDSTSNIEAVFDLCAASGPIKCKIAARVKTGTFTIGAGGATLAATYSDGSTATLAREQDCKGALALHGSDWGRTDVTAFAVTK